MSDRVDKLIDESLKTEASVVYNYLKNFHPHMRSKVREIAEGLDYDTTGAMSFTLELLEYVNAHDVFAATDKLFKRMSKAESID